MDCVPFLSNGSEKTKPEVSCCSGFETVLNTNAECICEAIISSAQMGIYFNVTKTMAMPSTCGMSTPPFQCDINPPSPSLSPSPEIAPPNPPKLSPKSSPKSAPAPKSPKPHTPVPPSSKTPTPLPSGAPLPPSSKTPTPSSSGGTFAQVPAPSPLAHAGSDPTTISFAVLVSMLFASFSCMAV
uniref:Bifunctional inhibitor/plant lipid transfer protein/seed storage helical domain-containing protein n=1 Tax=Fagus sylvatica TaxID=28930 RepID=A0A2N9G859_FAGSY